jgi:hypothetical protein
MKDSEITPVKGYSEGPPVKNKCCAAHREKAEKELSSQYF